MQSWKDSVLSIVRQHQLTPVEMKLWYEMLDDLPEAFCADILAFLTLVPNGVQLLTTDLREKLEALRDHNLDAWTAVFENNKQIVNALD